MSPPSAFLPPLTAHSQCLITTEHTEHTEWEGTAGNAERGQGKRHRR